MNNQEKIDICVNNLVSLLLDVTTVIDTQDDYEVIDEQLERAKNIVGIIQTLSGKGATVSTNEQVFDKNTTEEKKVGEENNANSPENE